MNKIATVPPVGSSQSAAKPIADLREWLSRVDAIGELTRVAQPVDRDEEMSAISYLVAKQQPSPAVLFERPRGFDKNPIGAKLLWNYPRCRAGVPNFVSFAWYALVAPPNTPKQLQEKINRDVVAILRDETIRQKLQPMMLESVGGDTSDTANFFASEAEVWGAVIKNAKISAQ